MTRRASEPTTPTLAIVSGGAGFMLLVVGVLLLHENHEPIRAFLRDAPLPDGGVLDWWRHVGPVHGHIGWCALGAAMVTLVSWLSPRWHARYAPRPGRTAG